MNQRQLFLNHVAQTSPAPMGLEIERASGVYLYDTSGKKYLDLIAGISVSNVGHCHPRVVEAVQTQVQKYMHTLVYGEFVLTPQVQLAKLLTQHLPASLDCVYFTNSGTEATEGAMKLAKRYTGRAKIVACQKSYHGSSQGAMSLMSEAYFTDAYRPLLPQIHYIRFNEASDLQYIDETTACVVMETVRAEIGVEVPKNDYLAQVKARCEAVGALLILDEIQVGCGRTGTLWAFEQYGVIPDILLLAKGLGGGMPLGAFVANKAIMEAFTHNPVLGNLTTFGGHPVACAAALASLQVLVSEPEWVGSVQQKSDYLKKMLQHPAILEVRAAGLLMAVEVVSAPFVRAVIRRCVENGLITDWFLFNENALRIAPPLIISQSELESACSIVLEAIDYYHQSPHLVPPAY